MKPLIISILLIAAILPIAAVCLAQSFDNPVASLQGKTVSQITGNVIRIALGLVGVIALILFILAGFTWMTAQGSAEKIKKAQEIMAWAGIGLIVIFTSYALLSLVFKVVSK